MSDSKPKMDDLASNQSNQMLALVDVINAHAKENAMLENQVRALVGEVESANQKIEMLKKRFKTQMMLVIVLIVLVILFCKRYHS